MSQILKLYDSNKDELTSANISGLNTGLYSITLSGAGTVNFYFDPFGVISSNMTTIYFFTKSAVTLEGTVEYYTEGDWSNNDNWAGCEPYDFSLNTTEAQRVNGLYPLMESHYMTPKRLHITSNGACIIWCKISTT